MQEWKAPESNILSPSLMFDSSRTKCCFGGFVGFFGGHVVDTSDLMWLGSVVGVAIAITAILALDQWAISYVVPLLTALKA